ncbi:LysR substrate-binding domain-containing protein [Candidatus Cyanaurora vandensis]|uniref:LysR substrate-binding domain-containing protein n=1 Tax=Candidatus Cyanaurora vandensis TaxID=2714958 RepID=UPI00257C5F6B|nr:LysR substrate-binding domain-containing protein [Candidatus Cyanaurora vandensis]
MSFNLEQLRILQAIVEQGSFKRAAEIMYISQPAVSLQIQNLERTLGVPIFNRAGRKAELTQAGKLLLDYAQRLLTLAEEARRAIEDLDRLHGGSLTIGASQTTGTYLMPRLIGLFRAQFPQVTVQLHVLSTRRTAFGVAEGRFDLGIVGGEVPDELEERLEVVPFAEDALALVVSADHELNNRAQVTKEDLYGLKFIALDPGSTTRKVVDEVLKQAGVDTQVLQIEMELSSIEAIKTAVQAGLGVAFVSTTAIDKELQLGILRKVVVQGLAMRRSITLLVDPNRYLPRAAQIFRKDILPHADEFGSITLKKPDREME